MLRDSDVRAILVVAQQGTRGRSFRRGLSLKKGQCKPQVQLRCGIRGRSQPRRAMALSLLVFHLRGLHERRTVRSTGAVLQHNKLSTRTAECCCMRRNHSQPRARGIAGAAPRGIGSDLIGTMVPLAGLVNKLAAARAARASPPPPPFPSPPFPPAPLPPPAGFCINTSARCQQSNSASPRVQTKDQNSHRLLRVLICLGVSQCIISSSVSRYNLLYPNRP
jgi:hypothetical protein